MRSRQNEVPGHSVVSTDGTSDHPPNTTDAFQLGDTQLNAIKTLTEMSHKKVEAQETSTSAPLPPPPKVIQQQQSSPTPTPASSPSPTNHHINHTPRLIPTDTPTPPRVRMQSKGAARYDLRSHTIYESPQHVCAAAGETLMCNASKNPDTEKTMQYKQLLKDPDKIIWERSFANEFGRLAQGVGKRIKGTNTIFFKPKSEVPFKTSKTRYGKIVCGIKPYKKEIHRTRLTVGGNLLSFGGNLSVPDATVTTTKCLVNSIVSTPKAKGLILDIANFYLNNKLPSHRHLIAMRL